ncbi:MAG: helix-turn-helix domain-containing protein [Gordonia sp. (in: high G+C Gram-positive bacteria)]
MTDALSERVATVGRQLRTTQQQLSDDVTAALMRGIEPLDSDPVLVAMLEASVNANVTNIVDVLANDIPLAHLQPPTAAVEYALRLAQRGIPSNALVRAYHMGQNVALRRCYEIIGEQGLATPETVALTAEVSAVLYRYIDSVTAEVFAAYEEERARWIGAQGSALSSTVHTLLAAPSSSAHRFERETGYQLDRDHRAMILWLTDDTRASLADLDRIARDAVNRTGAAGPPLIAPMDGSSLWVWIPSARHPRGSTPADVMREVSLPGGVRVAFGLVGSGVEGFCRSHEQARAAFAVASIPASPTASVVSYDDRGIAVASMLAKDVDVTRVWVHEVLRELAVDTPGASPLRETLNRYFATGESHLRTAEQLQLHRNTVKYRIDKALAAVRPDTDRLDLALALTACEFLGPLVLSTQRT